MRCLKKLGLGQLSDPDIAEKFMDYCLGFLQWGQRQEGGQRGGVLFNLELLGQEDPKVVPIPIS